MARQSHVDQAGDHHSDPEHPTGGQEQEGEEVAHHLRGHEARGELKTGDHTETPQCGRRWMKLERLNVAAIQVIVLDKAQGGSIAFICDLKLDHFQVFDHSNQTVP